MINKKLIIAGALLGMLGVGLGAFGAHGLKDILAANQRTANFETAVDYHFVHAIAMLFIGLLHAQLPSKMLSIAGWLLGVGILFFSGALYMLSLTNVGIWGAVAPIGGTAFMAGWGLLAYAVARHR